MDKIWVDEYGTSYGCYVRFFKEVEDGRIRLLSYLQPKRLNEKEEWIAKPDTEHFSTDSSIPMPNEGNLTLYDPNKIYTIIFNPHLGDKEREIRRNRKNTTIRNKEYIEYCRLYNEFQFSGRIL